ncbi:MAG: CRISPR-associated endonuclease Cas1 [Patescibacteria group bacterium]|nr:MAG: CRISPR-associated endonuclease Cas1 [Patescibacteria group bacterium]
MNLYVLTQGAKIGIKEGEFYIQNPEGKILSTYPQKLVENLFIFGNVFLTTQAINFCLKNKIRVLFLSSKGDYIGSLISIDQERVFLKYKQWQIFKQEEKRIFLTRIILKEKFKNQRGLIYSFCKNQNKIDLYDTFKQQSEKLLKQIDFVSSIETLRGLEGSYSSCYFSIFPEIILNKKFRFFGRNHYPPKDEINSILSFGYTLLVNFITGFIVANSLDPYVGFFHENKYKRENLSLDIMEEFRPNIDQIILKLINLKMIDIEDFEKKDDLVLIKKEALHKIFNLFQKEIVNNFKLINRIESRLGQIIKYLNENEKD